MSPTECVSSPNPDILISLYGSAYFKPHYRTVVSHLCTSAGRDMTAQPCRVQGDESQGEQLLLGTGGWAESNTALGIRETLGKQQMAIIPQGPWPQSLQSMS